MHIENKAESPEPLTADEIAELADKGEDVSRFFTGKGKMMLPMPRQNEDERNGQTN